MSTGADWDLVWLGAGTCWGCGLPPALGAGENASMSPWSETVDPFRLWIGEAVLAGCLGGVKNEAGRFLCFIGMDNGIFLKVSHILVVSL